MADSLKDRLTSNLHLFTYIGVDYFGPFKVRRGRILVKIYGDMEWTLPVWQYELFTLKFRTAWTQIHLFWLYDDSLPDEDK